MTIGWHLGNDLAITDIDWEILRRTKPSAVTFLTGQRIGRQEGERLLEINPLMHFIARPYYHPSEPTDQRITEYIDQCKRAMDEWAWAPRLHLSPYNEPNMPRWANWEGFGDQYDDMRRFNDVYARTYRELKAHNPGPRIGWTPLTPGNRDVWFPGDPVGHYYLHGPEGCQPGTPTPEAIKGGPCYESLLLADEYYAHVYIHNEPDAWARPWYGLRYRRYMDFFPKPMDVWIKEAGFPNAANWPAWGDEALLKWLDLLLADDTEMLRGVTLWILGDKEQWGKMWYDGDKPREVVNRLPKGKPVTRMDTEAIRERLETDLVAVRWHAEESVREIERAMDSLESARRRLLDLVVGPLVEREKHI